MRLADSTGKMGTYMVLVSRNGTADDFGSTPPPFSLLELKKSEQEYKVVIAPGYVREILTIGAKAPESKIEGINEEVNADKGETSGPDGVKFHEPLVDGGPKSAGTSIFSDPPPEFTMKPGNLLYCNFKTENDGTVSSVTVVVATKEKKTRHYQPKNGDGEGGLVGNYYVRLGRLAVDKDGKPIWKKGQNSDIEHYHDLPTFKNIGEGSGVLKGRKADSDQYEVRKVKGRYGLTDEINSQRDEQVELNIDVENVGSGEKLIVEETDDPNKPAKKEDTPMKVRTIRALRKDEASASGGEPQIRVVTEEGKDGKKGDSVIIKGNGIRGSIAFNDCDGKEVSRLAWEDGSIITSGDSAVTLGDCDDDRRGSGSDTPPPP